MKQRVIVGRPPVFDRCVAQFGILGKPVIFSWGDVIYNPEDVDITKELFAHEAVHGERQGTEELGITRWWMKYLDDPMFRYDEELAAHRAEWQAYMRRRPGRDNTVMLNAIAGRLAGPLYGNIATIACAKDAIVTR